MSSYIAIPGAVLGIALAIYGTAALRSGWILPWLRGQVVRPALYGSSQLLMGAALLTHAGSALAGDAGVRATVSLLGAGLLLAGVGLLFASQLARSRR
ncbi:hypothetical protein ACIRSU_02620 [Streptomyces sp. NPDC101160]|uniref:hypothetical protein n=1 Tax=Streptomyces sp. NPDC101160 TaxID=3366118 RepID=UPI00382101F1